MSDEKPTLAEEDLRDIRFREEVLSKISKVAGYQNGVEEYPVHMGDRGGAIDIVAEFNHPKAGLILFVIECKGSLKSFKFPPAGIRNRNSWCLGFRFTKKISEGINIDTFPQLPIYYATDISVGSEKNKFDQFYNWSTQTSNNFMGLAVDENNERQKNTNIQDMNIIHMLPILVVNSILPVSQSIVINPHPFNFEHLSLKAEAYKEPLERGENRKHAFILVGKNGISNFIEGFLKA